VAESKPEYRAEKTLHTHALNEILQGEENMRFRKLAVSLKDAGLDRCPMQAVPDVSEAERTQKLFTGDLVQNLAAGGRFSAVSPVYPFATENIGGYFPKIDFNGKSLLGIAASGDHAINAFAAGAANVTCFDLNYLSRHMVELKLRLLGSLDLGDYCRFLLEGPDAFNADVYNAVRSGLPLASRYFWDKAYACFGGQGASLRSSALFKDTHDARTAAEKTANALRNNPYLSSPAAYAAARAACEGKNATFIQSDVRELHKKLDRNYDIVLLSNISDYAHRIFEGDYLAAYREKIVAPLAQRLMPGGVMAMGYVYDELDLHGSTARSAINDADARRKVFGMPEYSEIRVPSTIDEGNHDSVLLWSRA
jgi:hypothetical protein